MAPDCIVFDEPTAMLDPQGRKEVMDTIRYLNGSKNITVVYITHFMEEIIYADKIIVMHQGEIVKSGKPLEIFKDVEGIKKINLDIPVTVELAYKLREEGIEIPDILTVDELVNALC